MERHQSVPMDMPATYRICIKGVLESGLAERFWGMSSGPIERIDEPEQTALVGEVADQAALVGVINTLYNSGHTVVSVERIHPDEGSHIDHTKEEA